MNQNINISLNIRFTLLMLCIFPVIAFAQGIENPLPWSPAEPVYDLAPQFPGGADAMNKYFAENIEYPEPEKSKGIQGYVTLKFEVTKKGKIINVSPVNGVPGGPNLVREAIRVVLMMPPWEPATKKGKPVQTEYQLSVPFNLNDRN